VNWDERELRWAPKSDPARGLLFGGYYPVISNDRPSFKSNDLFDDYPLAPNLHKRSATQFLFMVLIWRLQA